MVICDGFVGNVVLKFYEAVAPLIVGLMGGHDAFVVRFQQTTPPVHAKGVEDTAFYRWFRLVSLNEVLVHGWDLAVSTGQDPEADPALARAAHEIMERALPASPRGGEVPFGPVVDSTPDAGPTERLANWCGRVTAPWMRPGDA